MRATKHVWIGTWVAAALCVSWLIAPPVAIAQNCGCDHVIDAKTTFVDATKLTKAVNPGQKVCLMAGTKPFLRLSNFRGSANQYLTFVNCGGQVIIKNSPRGFGFVMDNSQYFKLTGSGDKKHTYGIKVDGTPKGASGLIFGERSSDFEVEYTEVTRTGFAGIIGKTDPNCSRTDMRGFVMRNVHFHHNYIHDTGGEGFYIGYFAFPTRVIKCEGKDTTLYPHRIEGVSIHHNILENNGWDAIQLGSAPSKASIHHNLIKNYATAKEQYQQSGIQLNAGAAADIYNNILLKGSGQGLAIFGYGGSKVYNNLVVGAGADGIYVNDKTAQTNKPYVIANNTIVQPKRYGIGLSVQTTKNNLVYNNLIVAPGALSTAGAKSYISFLSPTTNYKLAGNLNIPQVGQASFVNPSKQSYQLQRGASAVDKGVPVASLGIVTDLDDKPRAIPAGKVDVGAYEVQPLMSCQTGATRTCQINGRQGTQRCEKNQWLSCRPTSNPAEPSAEPGFEGDQPDELARDAAAIDTSPPADKGSVEQAPVDVAVTDIAFDSPLQDTNQPKTPDTTQESTSPTSDAPPVESQPKGGASAGCGCHGTPSGPYTMLFFIVLCLVVMRRRNWA